MTGKKGRVTVFQFFALLFTARVLIVLFINGSFTGGNHFLDNVISCLLGALANCVLALPLYFLYRAQPAVSVPAGTVQLAHKAGRLAPAYYTVYFVLIDSIYLSLFQLFMANVMEPNAVTWVLGLVTVAAACYAACLGLEAIVRAAVVMMVIVLLGTALILSGLFGRMDWLHLRPLFFEGPRQALQGCIVALGFGSELPALAILMPHVKGKRLRGFLWWNALTYGFTALVIFAAVAACGDYLNNQLFPLYTAASVAHLSILERMDVLFVIAWMGGLFLKLAVDFHMIRQCTGLVCKRANHPAAIFVAGAVVFVVTQVVFSSLAVQKILLNIWVALVLSLVASAGVPLVLLVMRHRKCRKEAQHP